MKLKFKALAISSICLLLLSGCGYQATYKINTSGKVKLIEEQVYDSSYLKQQKTSIKKIIANYKASKDASDYSFETSTKTVNGKKEEVLKITMKNYEKASTILGKNSVTVDKENDTVKLNLDATTIVEYASYYMKQNGSGIDSINIVFEMPYPVTKYNSGKGVKVSGNKVTYNLKKYSGDTFKITCKQDKTGEYIAQGIGWGIVAIGVIAIVISYTKKKHAKNKAKLEAEVLGKE